MIGLVEIIMLFLKNNCSRIFDKGLCQFNSFSNDFVSFLLSHFKKSTIF